MRRAPAAVLLPATLAALAGVQCRSATDVRVGALSQIDCASGARVALVVASSPQGLAQAAPASVSTQCSPASGAHAGEFDYGTVVVSPASSNDEPMAFALLTRPDGQPPETCLDPAQASSCIEESRQMRFAAHEEVSVPVELWLSCKGVVCPAGQTCVKNGQCVGNTLPVGCVACGEGVLTSTAPSCGDVGGLQAGSPWPMPGYCPTRAGRSGRNGPQTPTVKWTFKMGGIATMSPAVGADGTVYVGSNDRTAYAVDPAGRLKWKAPVGSNINRTGFLVGADGTAFVGCADTRVYAFAAGVVKWTAPVQADVALPLVAGGDGSLYVNGIAGAPPTPAAAPLFALAAVDGSIRWTLPANFGSGAVTIGNGGTVYASGADAKLYALRPADGSTIWSAPTASPPGTASVGDDGTIYVADGQSLYAFTPAGARVWATAVDAPVDGLALAADGTIYAASHATLFAVAPDGAVRWTLGGTAGFTAPPIVGGDGTIYVGGNDGTLSALSPAGEVLWKVTTGGSVGSQPALGADGTLYFVSSDGNLYAIGP